MVCFVLVSTELKVRGQNGTSRKIIGVSKVFGWVPVCGMSGDDVAWGKASRKKSPLQERRDHKLGLNW